MPTNFPDFMRGAMGQEGGGSPMPAQQPPPPPNEELLMLLLALFQMGAEQTRGQRGMTSPMTPFPQGTGEPMNMHRPDAGDVYDYHNSNGDPGIMGLFGSNPPALRQPPPGVTKRRGY